MGSAAKEPRFDQGLVSRQQLMTVPAGRDVSPEPA
jgi:hypothetical protein